jgi:hypothetical protein
LFVSLIGSSIWPFVVFPKNNEKRIYFHYSFFFSDTFLYSFFLDGWIWFNCKIRSVFRSSSRFSLIRIFNWKKRNITFIRSFESHNNSFFRSLMKKKFFKLNMIFYNIQLWLIFNSIFILNFIQMEMNQKVSINLIQKLIIRYSLFFCRINW